MRVGDLKHFLPKLKFNFPFIGGTSGAHTALVHFLRDILDILLTEEMCEMGVA